MKTNEERIKNFNRDNAPFSIMDFGAPTKSYYDIVRQGYIDCGFDTAILDKAVDESMAMAQQRMERGGMRMW